MESRRLRRRRHFNQARIQEIPAEILVRIFQVRHLAGRPSRWWEVDTTTNNREIGCKSGRWLDLVQDHENDRF
jgi:hypothetical protein